MSLFYKPNRKSDYNYGGPRWRLSRSKIALFTECPRCFYIDNKLGVARPPGFPFNLNSAVDALLKKEFDVHRAKGEPHPIMQEYKIDVLPFSHASLDVWRENFKGVECKHEPTGMTVAGAVDDLWVNKAGELIVVDYKSTSKDARIVALDEAWHDGYKRQMETYQWLLRQNGFKVNDTGYFVYANASKDRDGFDGRLEFELTLIPYTGDASWVDKTLLAIKECLDSNLLPAASLDCDYCRYRESTGKALLPFANSHAQSTPATSEKSSIKKSKKKDQEIEKTHETAQLF
jgi:hypothetical protein